MKADHKLLLVETRFNSTCEMMYVKVSNGVFVVSLVFRPDESTLKPVDKTDNRHVI